MSEYLKNLKTNALLNKSFFNKGKNYSNVTEETILMEQQDKVNSDLHNKIIEWFIQNPYPKDDAVHSFAEKLGIDPDKFETHIYNILSNILTEGKSKGFTGKYDPKQLKAGTKVEYEHTDYTLVAEKIARDHLAEIPDYYLPRLADMEREAGVED